MKPRFEVRISRLIRSAALELEQRVECRRQRLQLGPLGGKRLGDDLLRGAVYARVGDGCEPVIELGVEIVETEDF
jgi:hypothetical protein